MDRTWEEKRVPLQLGRHPSSAAPAAPTSWQEITSWMGWPSGLYTLIAFLSEVGQAVFCSLVAAAMGGKMFCLRWARMRFAVWLRQP